MSVADKYSLQSLFDKDTIQFIDNEKAENILKKYNITTIGAADPNDDYVKLEQTSTPLLVDEVTMLASLPGNEKTGIAWDFTHKSIRRSV